MSYHLGIDLGTTFSAAAVSRPGRPVADVVSLGERSSAVPSAVGVDERGGFLFGTAAERRALSDPGRVARGFKRRIGDGVPVLVGGVPVAAEELAARFVARIVADVAAREDGRASGIAVTHPASWGPHKLGSFRAALAAQGLGSVLLLPEPQAAAVGYAAAERVEPGAVVAVYDLGGGTFDAAVARKLPDGGFELLGDPEGIDGLGGLDFDEAVLEHARSAIGPAWDALDAGDPAVLTAVGRLRRECAEAKEALSADTEVVLPVVLPGLSTRVRLGRPEFEDMIRPAVAETVAALLRALDSAGFAPADVDTVLLVGGSSRIPLVAQLVSAALGRPAAVDVDPKAVIAAGAALAARALATPRAVPGAGPAPVGDGPDADRVVPRPVPPPPPEPRPLTRPDAGPPPRRRAALSLAGAAVVAAVLVGGALAGLGRPEATGGGTPSPAVAETLAPPTTVVRESRAPAPQPERTTRRAPRPPDPAPETTTEPPEPTTTPPTTEPPTTTPPPDPDTPPDPPVDGGEPSEGDPDTEGGGAADDAAGSGPADAAADAPAEAAAGA